MFTLLKQEAMKAWKQNRVYIWAIIAFVLPIITLTSFVPMASQASAYGALGGSSIIITIGMLVLTALSFTQEFTFGTIRPLLSRQYSRLQIFLAKIITVIVEYFLLIVFSLAGTAIGRLIFRAMHDGATEKIYTTYYTSLDWKSFLFALLMSFVGSLFLMAIVLLVSNIAKSSAAAISLGIVMSVATSILSAVTSSLIQLWAPLKWNPLTVQNVVSYYSGTSDFNKSIQSYFGAGAWVLFVVYGAYVLVMYALAYWVFNRRSV
ncbi:ABC transporter permease subunit [Fructobacillus americanaquae]|uniref:ABC transporter permease n=1 Tax=Fructobacillus americanaquae TaxID=2940302 RepID=A0ABY5BYA8_9LACO|nr:ABC transporter permease subunit [Fructobacillus americanaquae]USS91490.1 ABC transporter permease [Fructobacillus americanaquae]